MKAGDKVRVGAAYGRVRSVWRSTKPGEVFVEVYCEDGLIRWALGTDVEVIPDGS